VSLRSVNEGQENEGSGARGVWAALATEWRESGVVIVDAMRGSYAAYRHLLRLCIFGIGIG